MPREHAEPLLGFARSAAAAGMVAAYAEVTGETRETGEPRPQESGCGRCDGRFGLPLIGRRKAELGPVLLFLDVQRQKKTIAPRARLRATGQHRPGRRRTGPLNGVPASRPTLVACRPLGILSCKSALGISHGHTSARAARVLHQRSRLREIVSPGATTTAPTLLQHGDVVTGSHRITIWHIKMKLWRISHRQ